jgi:hypothetical protein
VYPKFKWLNLTKSTENGSVERSDPRRGSAALLEDFKKDDVVPSDAVGDAGRPSVGDEHCQDEDEGIGRPSVDALHGSADDVTLQEEKLQIKAPACLVFLPVFNELKTGATVLQMSNVSKND